MKNVKFSSNKMFNAFYEIARKMAGEKLERTQGGDDYSISVDASEVMEEAVKVLGIRRNGIDQELLKKAVESAVDEEIDSYEFAMNCISGQLAYAY